MSDFTIRTSPTPPATVKVQLDPSQSVAEAVAAADAAAASEAAALASETAAAGSASSAATSASAASTSASAAAVSASEASTDADDAAASAAAAAATLASSLKIDQNLADLDDAAVALTNLGLTATAAEINTLDGITASTAELNTLDGVTASTADINAGALIGVPFPVWDHIAGCPIPSNAGTAKFIKLTAGLTGAGQYNEGLLTSESVAGSAPAITATAVIVGGPMNGQTVPLVNTEQAFIRPRTTSGALQSATAIYDSFGVSAASVPKDGNAVQEEDGAVSYTIDWAPAGTFGANQNTSRTFGSVRPRNRSATFYMRIL